MGGDPLHAEDDATAGGGPAHVRAVCRRFLPTGPLAIVPLHGAGFSGSRVYRVGAAGHTANEGYVCKAFAEGVDEARVRWIHGLMSGLRAAGSVEVPTVIATAAGSSVVTDSWGIHWELIEFRPGLPTAAPTPAQATGGMESLARIHVAGAGWAGPTTASGRPPAVMRRVQLAERMRARPWSVLMRPRGQRAAARPGLVAPDDLHLRLDAAVRIFATVGPRVLERIRRLEPVPVPCQPVLRDVWADHVLFSEQNIVTGVIDYHAAAIDTPATDIARLLGSWTPPRPAAQPFSAWEPELAAYERIRPLGAGERRLVPLLAASGILFGLDNWFRWLLEEKRAFFQPTVVLTRIDRLLQDLPAALEFLAGWTEDRGLTG